MSLIQVLTGEGVDTWNCTVVLTLHELADWAAGALSGRIRWSQMIW